MFWRTRVSEQVEVWWWTNVDEKWVFFKIAFIVKFMVDQLGWLVECFVNNLLLYLIKCIWLILSRIADAEENLGESEVREAHLAKSLFFIRIGDQVINCFNSLFFISADTQFMLFPVVSYLFIFYLLDTGKSIGTTQSDRKQNCCSWTKDGLSVLYAAAWLLLHGFWSNF